MSKKPPPFSSAVCVLACSSFMVLLLSLKPFSIALALSLTVMLLLRIPNQICVALSESHGWYSVFGTVMGATGFGLLAYETYQKSKEDKKSKSN